MVKLQTGKGRIYETMTVSEVIAELQKFDPDLPVLATWDGQFKAVDGYTLLIEPHGLVGDGTEALVLDVN
ncbi:hypothetical protein [Pararobbsia alpina]|uniref:Uncharacterized protein n=1 Tax=Pararobbsia alpina TaxID=621374 RepID=A0A6S7BMA3_9BURK|nr:hypothetical protein [Pararobbsia alpina]CAB3805556.1 hypothetical protein LMG28138_05677 [Pararobbsia alpina]